jgi:hypothetical protein
MSPSYPHISNVNSFYYIEQYVFNKGEAEFIISLYADIPENCTLFINATDTLNFEFSNITLYNKNLSFVSTQFMFIFDGSEPPCADAMYRGFAALIEGNYVPLLNSTEIIGSKNVLIIGLCAGSFVIICIFIFSGAIFFIRKRQSRYNKIYKILKDMHISSEEIVEMKEKSDEFMIMRKNLHIYFHDALGKGVSSTVYKGHLLGTAPLHEQQKSVNTEKFIDCTVAVKVANRLGQTEVEELFKEVNAMKMIEYHENVACLLGWAFHRESLCLVLEIAQKDLLNYVKEFRETLKEMIPYKNFISILRQIIEGNNFILYYSRPVKPPKPVKI